MPQFFTPRFKQSVRVAAAAATMVSGAAPFVGGLLALQWLGDDARGALPALLALASFCLGAALPWLAQNLMGLAGNGALRRRLSAFLTQERHCDLSGACFVGFSPGEQLHIWQGETDRDIGFLTLAGGDLLYHGDDFSWHLPRDQIDHIDLTPVEAGLQRILIRWHVPREAGRSFSLESREARSISRARVATNGLYRRLKDWQRDEAASCVGEDPALGLPPTDMSGAQVIEEPPSGSCLSIAALGVIVVTAVWRVSQGFFACGQYYQGVLWAGLISVLGALSTGYLLHYLQAWEAARGHQRQKVR